MNINELNLLIENFPHKYSLRRYKSYIENIEKSISECQEMYNTEIKKIKKIGWIEIEYELDIILDTYKKSNEKIDRKGIESVFTREDIFELAVSFKPIYRNGKIDRKQFENYIKKFRWYLDTVKYADFQNVFGEHFPTEETLRKELSKYIKNYESGIKNIKCLVNRYNIYIINVECINDNALCIDCYRYHNQKLEKKNKEIYKVKGLNLYIDAINKGKIDYSVLQQRSSISNVCCKKIKKMLKGLYYNNECFLMVSEFSTGIINYLIHHNYKKYDLELVRGDLKELLKLQENFPTENP